MDETSLVDQVDICAKLSHQKWGELLSRGEPNFERM